MSDSVFIGSIHFLNEEETKKLSSQKLRGWIFAIEDEHGNHVIPKFSHPYNYLLHNLMIEVTKNKKSKVQIKQKEADLLMKRSK
tara:strand:- start:152 stop:403 length:252 start_codon:yes stop_codon:yes gene_type:complete